MLPPPLAPVDLLAASRQESRGRRSFADVTLAELAALRPPISPESILGSLHRVTRWPVEEGDPRPALGRDARAFVDQHFDLSLPTIVQSEPSSDAATKLLLGLSDGATIEAVHMPRAVKNPRVTMCISSQVGCAMGCTFCRTAKMGLVRNLSPAEIVGQVFVLARTLGPVDPGRISVVFMGMGEPLHNAHSVLRAVEILCQTGGLGLSPQRITVSTAGLVPGIEELARAKVRPTLALSLNATTDEARRRTMPIAHKYSLADLKRVLVSFPLASHEKITLEYVLLRGENDTQADAERLAEFSRGYRHIVNVIPWNPFPDTPHDRPSQDEVERFAAAVHKAGALVTVRKSRGQDVSAACGQLATNASRRPRHALDVRPADTYELRRAAKP